MGIGFQDRTVIDTFNCIWTSTQGSLCVKEIIDYIHCILQSCTRGQAGSPLIEEIKSLILKSEVQIQ